MNIRGQFGTILLKHAGAAVVSALIAAASSLPTAQPVKLSPQHALPHPGGIVLEGIQLVGHDLAAPDVGHHHLAIGSKQAAAVCQLEGTVSSCEEAT